MYVISLVYYCIDIPELTGYKKFEAPANYVILYVATQLISVI